MVKQVFFILSLLLMSSCNSTNNEVVINEGKMKFSSSDSAIVESFEWAQKMALSYAHDGSDKVGYWYEASLPGRNAFCMRDVSHQSIGAEILSLSEHNNNMMVKFAENISENRDWCTFWEINNDNLPAPVDYRNDKEFWYNLNGNFDVIFAIERLYQWSGNSDYINNPAILNFIDKSLNDYVERWDLSLDKIMKRERFMNTLDNFNMSDSFHYCRGLPSYVESVPGIVNSADLIASIYAGYSAASSIAKINNDTVKAAKYSEIADGYKNLLKEQWWSDADNAYRNYLMDDGSYLMGEGCTHILWFNASGEPERIKATIESLAATPTNIENLSYFPKIFYDNGYADIAHKLLATMPSMDRSDYPELSYGLVEAVVSGMMGIEPSFSAETISTIARLNSDNDWAMIENLPIFGGMISVKHNSSLSTAFTNNSGDTIKWIAVFNGDFDTIKVDGKEVTAKKQTDKFGKTTSYCEIELANNASSTATI